MPFGGEKLAWLGYAEVENFEDIFIRFNTIHQRDRHPDRHTHTDKHRMTAYAALMHSIARQKLYWCQINRRNLRSLYHHTLCGYRLLRFRVILYYFTYRCHPNSKVSNQ